MKRFLNLLLLFSILVLIYFVGSFSKIPFGDCIGFVLYGEKREFIFSTSTYSHFLFSNTIILFSKIFHQIESSEIARYIVIISSGITILVFNKIIFSITKKEFISFFASILFGLSFSFWKNSEIVEIYSFNMIWVGTFLWYSIQFLMHKKFIHLYLSSLFLGISMFSHIQNILMFPGFMILLFWVKNSKQQIISSLIFASLFASLLLVQVINNEKISAIFSSGVIAEKLDPSIMFRSFVTSIGYLIYNFWYFLVFIIFGIKYMYQHYFKIFSFLVVTAIPIFVFGVVFSVSDNYVFFIPFNFICALFIGIGLFKLKDLKQIKYVSISAILLPLFYFTTFKLVSKTEVGMSFESKKSYKGGLKYYLVPWMNDNVGVLEFIIEKRQSPDPMEWMIIAAEEFIYIKKSKNKTLEQIKKL